jgi:hypothetical protein
MQDSQSGAGIICYFVNDVLERLQCDICEFAMDDPVQLQTPDTAIFKGCRKCITPIGTNRRALRLFPQLQLISLLAVKQELDMTAAICEYCSKIMPRAECVDHMKHCKVNQTLSHCDLCHEFYQTTKLDAHEKSEHHVRAAYEKTTAELESLKHERESDELPPAKRQKIAPPVPKHGPEHDDEKAPEDALSQT